MIDTYYNSMTPAVFNKVKDAVLSGDTPWYALSTDYFNFKNVSEYSHSWAHLAYTDSGAASPLGDLLHMAVLSAFDNVGIKASNIFRIRLGLHGISPTNYVGGAHVDFNLPHKVALIYLNNSDGDTFIFNQRYDPVSNSDTYFYFQEKHNGVGSVLARITPEENKMICFDGLHYHSSSCPTTVAKRIVINVNYN